VLLTEGNPVALAGAVRSQVYAVDPDQPLMDVRTMDRLVDDYVLSEPRFSLVLFSIFAALGLTLAVVGVYGVISSTVSRRTQEIGVRMALGAQPGEILRAVLKRALILVPLGVGLGLAASYATARVMREQLWNVSPFDPLSFVAVSALLLAAGLAASYWPARREHGSHPGLAVRVTAARCVVVWAGAARNRPPVRGARPVPVETARPYATGAPPGQRGCV
jgi:putative ABC transport system permease protein